MAGPIGSYVCKADRLLRQAGYPSKSTVTLSKPARRLLRDLHPQTVAGRMACGVVDVVEPVEAEVGQGAGLAVALESVHLLRALFFDMAAVVERGSRRSRRRA